MWDWIINIIAQILTFIVSFAGDWGLSIIILTCIIRLALTPLTISSTRSTAKMQILQPRILEIQERYQDDPVKMQEEVQKIYKDNKFNPLGGCLPILIQMPVFFALFSVLRNQIPADACFYNILSSLSITPNDAVSQLGWAGAWVYVAFDLAFGLLTLIPLILNSQNQDSAQASQSRTMGAVMAIMMIWVGWNCPAGVILYYVTSSAWGVVQQLFITRKVMEKAKADEAKRLENQPVNIDVVRREHKARPHKKG